MVEQVRGSRLLRSLSLMLAGALAVTLLTAVRSKAADNMPADKMTVTGANFDVAGPGEKIPLLSAQMRTSAVEDLVFQVTAECAILTALSTNNNDTQNATGTARVWVEVDGQAVPVVPGHQGSDGDGHVVFCNRAYQRTTSFLDPTATIDDFIDTREANAFNWVAMNLGNGIHQINVFGELTQTATSTKDTVKVVIGNRTLVVNPTTYIQNQS
jgi:hypothetical protein